MSNRSREFPDWYIVAQSTGERYDDDTYMGAKQWADQLFLDNRSEHFQVFCDNGSGKPEMMYDAFVGDQP
jgi:hypothetical protein